MSMPNRGPLRGVTAGKSEPAPPGLRVVETDDENDDWLNTINRERADSNQPRVPAGSSQGGQWTSGGGGGGAASATAALQQKLVERYGVPAQKAALMWERDIKARMAAAKLVRAEQRLERRALAGKKGLQVEKRALVAKKKSDDEANKKQAVDESKQKADKARERRRQQRAKKTEQRLADLKKRQEEQERHGKELAAKKREGDIKNRGEHPDVDAHELALKATHGDAARTVAWGRAMHDRGRALGVSEYTKHIDALTEAGVPGFQYHDRIIVRGIIRSEKPKNVGELADALRRSKDTLDRRIGDRLEAGAAVVAHRVALEKAGATFAPDGIKLQPMTVRHGSVITDKSGKPIIDTDTGHPRQTGYVPPSYVVRDGLDHNLAEARSGIETARKTLTAFAHKDIVMPENYKFEATERRRANCDSKTFGPHNRDVINVGAQYPGQDAHKYARVMTHEMSHAIETENPGRLAASIAYLKSRTQGAALRRYKSGDAGEMVWEDKFPDEYMGKRYVDRRGKQYATEISSMSVQDLSHGSKWATLYSTRKDEGDRESAHFALGFLANQ
jgi:hypothetical protein